MTGRYRRREILAAAGSTGFVVLPGCSGGEDTEPTDTTGGDSDGGGGGTGTDDQSNAPTGGGQESSDAVYADDHMEITETDDGYRLTMPGWPDDYVGTAEHRHISPEGSTSTYPVQYDPVIRDSRSMSSPQYHIVTPGFHVDSYVAPFVWGNQFFEPDTPQLDVWYVPPGEDVYDREIVFRDLMPEDIYTRIDDTPLTVAHIDPTQFGWTSDPESGEELWVHLVGQERNEEVDLSYTWGEGGSQQGDALEVGVPPGDVPPRELMPRLPDGWELQEHGSLSASAARILAGHGGDYIGPDEDEYRVHVLQFRSEELASSLDETVFKWSEWPVYVPLGTFGFAGKERKTDTPNTDNIVTLLGHSPVLSEEYVRNNNMSQ